MSEKIKMTDGELAEVKMLQEKFQHKIFQIGQLTIQKMETASTMKHLSEQEIKLEDEWNTLKKMENELIEKLLSKYGEGSLDMREGTFISEKKPSVTS
jgi:hypothetical protein